MADAFLANAFLGGTFLADAFLAGAFLADAFLAGAFLAGALLAGTLLAGTFLGGARPGGTVSGVTVSAAAGPDGCAVSRPDGAAPGPAWSPSRRVRGGVVLADGFARRLLFLFFFVRGIVFLLGWHHIVAA